MADIAIRQAVEDSALTHVCASVAVQGKTTATSDPLQLIDSEELASLLGSTPEAVRKARARGHIPPGAKIPGLGLRWRRIEVQKWLEQRFAEDPRSSGRGAGGGTSSAGGPTEQ